MGRTALDRALQRRPGGSSSPLTDPEVAREQAPRPVTSEPPSLTEFRRFAEASAEFARAMMSRLGVHPEVLMARWADANLSVTRAIFGKWSAEIIVLLYDRQEMGFEDLRRHLPGLSPRVLSKKLKELERLDMVRREEVSVHPARVHYSLTDTGTLAVRLAEPLLLFLRLATRTPPGGAAPAGEETSRTRPAPV